MSPVIGNAKDTPLNVRTGTVPDVSGALTDWFQPMVFTRVTKADEAFQAVETPYGVGFQGVIQPFTERALLLKPEGQRAWSWFLLHSDPSLTLNVDEIVTYNGTQTRVMARKDYSLYGYIEYHLVQDWTGTIDAVPTLPDAPGLAAASGPGTGQIALSWDGPTLGTEPISLTLKRAAASGGPYLPIAIVTGLADYVDLAPLSGTNYYVVSAENAAGIVNSNEASAEPLAVVPVAPGPITLDTIAPGGSGNSLSWTGPDTGDSPITLTIRRSLVSGGPYDLIATVAQDTRGYLDPIVDGIFYYYVIQAVNAGGTTLSNELGAQSFNGGGGDG